MWQTPTGRSYGKINAVYSVCIAVLRIQKQSFCAVGESLCPAVLYSVSALVYDVIRKRLVDKEREMRKTSCFYVILLYKSLCVMLANPATLGMMNGDNNAVIYLKCYIYYSNPICYVE